MLTACPHARPEGTAVQLAQSVLRSKYSCTCKAVSRALRVKFMQAAPYRPATHPDLGGVQYAGANHNGEQRDGSLHSTHPSVSQ